MAAPYGFYPASGQISFHGWRNFWSACGGGMYYSGSIPTNLAGWRSRLHANYTDSGYSDFYFPAGTVNIKMFYGKGVWYPNPPPPVFK